MSFGYRVKTLREARNMTQTQLAQRIGVCSTQVSRWENGMMPQGRNLYALALVLETSVDYLCTSRESNAPES